MFFIFLVHGMGILMPWNMFITAKSVSGTCFNEPLHDNANNLGFASSRDRSAWAFTRSGQYSLSTCKKAKALGTQRRH